MDAGAKLDHMANQIAAFFRPYPEAEAVAGTHDHIAAFWTPRMRRDLIERIAAGRATVDPLVVAALATPAPAASAPARDAAAGPDQAGAIGASDAG